MTDNNSSLAGRVFMMVTGILFICICVGSYRLSRFGVDAFTCMNLGISGYLGMVFGTWQMMVNAVILLVVFFTVRRCIGAGTIVNMVCVGYGADLICWLFQDVWQVEMTLPLRILALLLGCLFAGLGVAFCLMAGNDLWMILGVGTVCNAFLNRPLIQFFRVHVAEPLLNR